MGVLVKGDDLGVTRLEHKGESSVLGSKSRTGESLAVRSDLVPDDNCHGLIRGVDELVSELVTFTSGGLDDVGTVRNTAVAIIVITSGSRGGALTAEGGKRVGEANQIVPEVLDNVVTLGCDG